MNSKERYEWAHVTPSDISSHIPTMFSFALNCNRITEFGVRGGVSTSAWLESLPSKLTCYDVAVPGCLDELKSIAEENRIQFSFIQADTSKVDIEETDLLFLDTLHTGEHLLLELKNHVHVRKYLIFHDTEFNGWSGEGGGKGLKWALIEFLLANICWNIVFHDPQLNGLTVLERK